MWVWEWKEATAIINMDFAYWTHKLWKDKVSIFLHVDPGSEDVFIHACVLAGYCGLFFDEEISWCICDCGRTL